MNVVVNDLDHIYEGSPVPEGEEPEPTYFGS